MNGRKIVTVLAGILTVWLVVWAILQFTASEETQMLRMQQKFLTALEARKWSTVDAMISNDYDDGDQNAAGVKAGIRKVLGGFFVLSITPEAVKPQVVHGLGMVKTRLKVEGTGSGLSALVVAQAKNMKEPWFFHWHKRGFWPWSWELMQIHNDGLLVPDAATLEQLNEFLPQAK